MQSARSPARPQTDQNEAAMKLIGNYLSPYVRRVAVTLNILGSAFELEELMVFKSPDRVRELNPVTRIPVLLLDDGSRLIESSAILDEIDQMAGPQRALTPPHGPQRRDVVQLTALAVACAEKAQWAFYERRVRPPEKVHQPWIDHNIRQVENGFAELERRLAEASSTSWLAGTDKISQADISTAVAFSFACTALPHAKLRGRLSRLSAFVDRCEDLEAFRRAPIPAAT
jgi:glutathione S-transferase